mgnify:CR=1 FL=1
MKKLSFIIRFGLSILILFLLFRKVGFYDVISNIMSVSVLFIILILIMFIISLILGAININLLLSPMSKKTSFYKILYYSILSWSVGLFIPGKVGELLLIPLLKKEGITIGQGSAIFIIDKLITLMTLSIFSLIGIFIFFDVFTFFKLAAIILLIVVIFIFFIFLKIGREIVKKYFLRKFSENFNGFFRLISLYFKKEKLILSLNTILTFLKWFITSLITYFLFIAYYQHVPLVYIFLINSILVMISLIPISLSGLGVRESAAVFLYSKLNIEPSITLSVFVIQIIMMYFTATVIALIGLKEVKFKITSN